VLWLCVALRFYPYERPRAAIRAIGTCCLSMIGARARVCCPRALSTPLTVIVYTQQGAYQLPGSSASPDSEVISQSRL
jgi:hypothetical protein